MTTTTTTKTAVFHGRNVTELEAQFMIDNMLGDMQELFTERVYHLFAIHFDMSKPNNNSEEFVYMMEREHMFQDIEWLTGDLSLENQEFDYWGLVLDLLDKIKESSQESLVEIDENVEGYHSDIAELDKAFGWRTNWDFSDLVDEKMALVDLVDRVGAEYEKMNSRQLDFYIHDIDPFL